MGFLRNLLAAIGVLSLIIGTVAYLKFAPMLGQVSNLKQDVQVLKQLDPKAKQVYTEVWDKLKSSGNSADATVWKVPVKAGLTAEAVEQSLAKAANAYLITNLYPVSVSEQAKAETGLEHRLFKTYQVCGGMTAMLMLEQSDAASAYLPCQVSLVQDKQGNLALYSQNMDMMIYGGKPLPPALLGEATKIKNSILDMVNEAAAGA